jgi:hypothetical protein
MDFDENLVIALVCGVVSMAMSTFMPCVLKTSTNPFLVDARRVYETNRQVIVVSSIIVAITAYLALSLYPIMNSDESVFYSESNDNIYTDKRFSQLLGQIKAPCNQLVESYVMK